MKIKKKKRYQSIINRVLHPPTSSQQAQKAGTLLCFYLLLINFFRFLQGLKHNHMTPDSGGFVGLRKKYQE